jgi:hypothetical protein
MVKCMHKLELITSCNLVFVALHSNKQAGTMLQSNQKLSTQKFIDESINLYVQGNKAMHNFLSLKRWSLPKLSLTLHPFLINNLATKSPW